jgi:hypothetical protein
MTTPTVTELPQALEPVTDDPFIECIARELDAAVDPMSPGGGRGSTPERIVVKTFERLGVRPSQLLTGTSSVPSPRRRAVA